MNTQTTHDCADARESIGQQLRSARIAKGYSAADVATRLRVLATVVQDIERDDFSRLGAPIFVRGHVSSYCRLLDIALPSAELAVDAQAAALPPLRPMTRSSRAQRALEHSARSLVYVVLSASIAIPVIWFALNAPAATAPPAVALTRLEPLPSEPAPVAASQKVQPGTTAGELPARHDAVANGVGADRAAPPVVASLGGFYPQTGASSPTAEAGSATGAGDAEVGETMVLHFRERSWLEVRSHAGTRLDEALVQAGEERRYPLQQVGRVILGNAAGVDVNVNDTPLDISAYRRANVARFKVSSDGRLAPADG